MKIAVLMGGPSSEREISFVTGRAVSEALRRLGHEVIQIDPCPAGPGESAGAPDPRTLRPHAAERRDAGAPGYLAFLAMPEFRDCEAVFIALHGEMGEDGRIQGALDLAGIPYTGSGSLASALSMSKDMSKKIFVNQGISTPRWLLISVSRAEEGGRSAGAGNLAPVSSDIEAIGGFSVVVKPNDQGSTIGLTVVENERGLPDAFEKALNYSNEVMVEKYIPGRELTVSILEGEALPVIEIIPQGGLYDYRRKYTKGESRYVVPAELRPDLTKAVKELGLRAFNALGCRGFGRVDMRLSPDDDLFCLEVNTIPGMTETSLVPMAAGAVNISFDLLVGRILASAAADRPRRRARE